MGLGDNTIILLTPLDAVPPLSPLIPTPGSRSCWSCMVRYRLSSPPGTLETHLTRMFLAVQTPPHRFDYTRTSRESGEADITLDTRGRRGQAFVKSPTSNQFMCCVGLQGIRTGGRVDPSLCHSMTSLTALDHLIQENSRQDSLQGT